VGFNGMIQGRLVTGATLAEPSRLVGELRYGVMLAAPFVDVSVTWVHRSPEVAGTPSGTAWHRFVQAALTFHDA